MDALLPIQLPAIAPGMATDSGPSTWAPAPRIRDADGVLGSWLPDLATRGLLQRESEKGL